MHAFVSQRAVENADDMLPTSIAEIGRTRRLLNGECDPSGIAHIKAKAALKCVDGILFSSRVRNLLEIIPDPFVCAEFNLPRTHADNVNAGFGTIAAKFNPLAESSIVVYCRPVKSVLQSNPPAMRPFVHCESSPGKLNNVALWPLPLLSAAVVPVVSSNARRKSKPVVMSARAELKSDAVATAESKINFAAEL